MSEVSTPPSGYESQETVHQLVLFESLRRAATEVLYSAEDELSREIAQKILAKVAIKERASELIAHADDVSVYQEYKKLGIFVVRDARATFGYKDDAAGLDLRAGDSYLDLHLPPVPSHLRSRDAVENSLDLIGQYVRTHGLRPRYLLGVTYGRLAEFARRRFDFSVAYPNPHTLPDAVVQGVRRVFENFTEMGIDGATIGAPAIVFMDTAPLFETQPQASDPARSLGVAALRHSAK